MYRYRSARCGPVTTGVCPRWSNWNRTIPCSVPTAAFGYGSMIRKPTPAPPPVTSTPAPPPVAPVPISPDPELSRLREENARLGREVTDVRRRVNMAEQKVVELERDIVLLKRQQFGTVLPGREIRILPAPVDVPVPVDIPGLKPAPGPITIRPGEATILPIAPAKPPDGRYYPIDGVPVRISTPYYGY